MFTQIDVDIFKQSSFRV